MTLLLAVGSGCSSSSCQSWYDVTVVVLAPAAGALILAQLMLTLISAWMPMCVLSSWQLLLASTVDVI